MSHPKTHESDLNCRCPHCGSDIREDATFCRECGASDDSGWSESDVSHAMACDGDFDYDAYVSREFGVTPHRSWGTVHYLALGTLIAFMAGLIATLGL